MLPLKSFHKEQVFCCLFSGAKGLNANAVHSDMCTVFYESSNMSHCDTAKVWIGSEL